MKLKKTPYYLALTLLTTGASLIPGFLSFGGMFALWPILSLACGAFILSIAYEGEIYLQNIKGALKKIFKYNYLPRTIASDYLLEHSPDTEDKDCPQFFKDYETQLHFLHQFGHKRLDEKSEAGKKAVEKTLKDMEKWFALQLFNTETVTTAYEKKLRVWLAAHHQEEFHDKYQARNSKFQKAKIFSTLAGLFMSVGTTYLLVGAFSTIPAFSTIALSTWPLFIVPMAAIAGVAYGLLTYNAITDMILNDTLSKWFNNIQNDLREGLNLRSGFMALTAAMLLVLALALTMCTAGTWWTVVRETRPLFAWMGRMPRFIMGIIHPVITGLSTLVFNLQNTSESLDLIHAATKAEGSFLSRRADSIRKGFNNLIANENWLQIINPFRLLLKLTVAPLRILAFFGHLVSIGVTADRVPGVPEVISALLGIISEGFEDAHYFVGHSHDEDDHEDHDHPDHPHTPPTTKALINDRIGADHGLSHNVDLPTRFIKLIFSPIYFLAACWDFVTSLLNAKPRENLTFTRAWEKQMGTPKDHSVTLTEDAVRPSSAWKIQQAIFCIERHKEKQLQNVWVGKAVAESKSIQLSQLQQDLYGLNPQEETKVSLRLVSEKTIPGYTAHRFFSQGQTSTSAFLEELPERIGVRVN